MVAKEMPMFRIVLPILISLISWQLTGCHAHKPLPEAAPFVHVVLFKTKGPEAASAELIKGIEEKLAPLPTVKGIWIGRPAPTNTRPIVDANYDVGLLLLFEDQKGLQEYLDHPTHKEFAAKHDTECTVRVFDFTPQK